MDANYYTFLRDVLVIGSGWIVVGIMLIILGIIDIKKARQDKQNG